MSTPLSRKNRQQAFAVLDDTIMILKKPKMPDLTPRRPRRRETITARRPGRRREHLSINTLALCGKSFENSRHRRPSVSQT